ncbi:NUDIX hydrolase [Ferrovibrio sp. MS7]|uniref:NUDIX hydrolase n=1 Tax=Ferrovibrio plantarum TaxID=3119164 RepID=UPI003135D380
MKHIPENIVSLLARQEGKGNSKWRVFYDHIRGANGTEVSDYLVLEPRSTRPDQITGASVLPLVGDRIVLLRTYRHPLAEFAWELPRGFVDPGEEPEAAALRELEEETGLLCEPSNLRRIGTFTPEASTIIGRGALFVASDCRPGGTRQEDEPGLGEMHFFTRAEIAGLLAQHAIQDASTLAALFLGLAHWPGS